MLDTLPTEVRETLIDNSILTRENTSQEDWASAINQLDNALSSLTKFATAGVRKALALLPMASDQDKPGKRIRCVLAPGARKDRHLAAWYSKAAAVTTQILTTCCNPPRIHPADANNPRASTPSHTLTESDHIRHRRVMTTYNKATQKWEPSDVPTLGPGGTSTPNHKDLSKTGNSALRNWRNQLRQKTADHTLAYIVKQRAAEQKVPRI
mmetsp:Transcript_42870/g.100601  ORF Transcript_42870/g.100601 Transcript_42870/m.100601 type:complete len:210 (+) Transcript_42870:778-1407(+)